MKTENHSLRLATRGSPLALIQAEIVKKKLESMGSRCEIKIFKTTGDRIQDKPLHEIGGKGLFIKELERALLADEADLAVHSLKDLPCKVNKDFELSCYLERDYPRDVIVLKKDKNFLESLDPKKALTKGDIKLLSSKKIATGSLRRSALLKLCKPDLEVLPIRGNIGTRLGKLAAGYCDALVLSEASLKRMSYDEKFFTYYAFDPEWFIPSSGQGVIALETLREPSFDLSQLNCKTTQKCTEIERGILESLGGSCILPIGVHCKFENSFCEVKAIVMSHDGKEKVFHQEDFSGSEESFTIIEKMKEKLYQKNVHKILISLGIPPLES